jgi:hypothetical protein
MDDAPEGGFNAWFISEVVSILLLMDDAPEEYFS